MYGARQAPYIFTTNLAEKLIGCGYRRATADASTFYRLAPDNVNFVILVITDDDFCSASNSEAYLEQCRKQLASVYLVKDLGPVHSLIGWRIQRKRTRRLLTISQPAYTLNRTKIRTRRMQICADPSPGLRPHCSHARGASDSAYEKTVSDDLEKLSAHSDSDWAGDKDGRKSTTGNLIIYGGGPVSWRSTIQKSVALSSCEAELVSLTETTKRVIWFRKLLTDLHRSHSGAVRTQHDDEMPTNVRGKQPPNPTPVDNQGGKNIAESTGLAKR
jgi:hypothetical protein